MPPYPHYKPPGPLSNQHIEKDSLYTKYKIIKKESHKPTALWEATVPPPL
jgi:CRISPR/Cas system CMR-associated protein Cmr3 (group 5 of RAMP superfamily)